MSGRRRRRCGSLGCVADKVFKVALVVVFGFIAVVIGANVYTSSQRSTTSATVTVAYTITGTTTGADLTYQTANGGTSQHAKAKVPQTITGTFTRGQHVYLSAQNAHEAGTVTCTITADGVEVASNTSSGAFTIATCSGTA